MDGIGATRRKRKPRIFPSQSSSIICSLTTSHRTSKLTTRTRCGHATTLGTAAIPLAIRLTCAVVVWPAVDIDYSERSGVWTFIRYSSRSSCLYRHSDHRTPTLHMYPESNPVVHSETNGPHRSPRTHCCSPGLTIRSRPLCLQ